MYQAFAKVYDLLMADVDYDAWAAHYARLMASCGVPGKKCVECACGSGSLTIALSKLGAPITGVDISEEMLALAMQKARDNGQRIPFVRQDMCALEVPTRVDAVLCTCDGVNYLIKPGQLQRFFSAAHQALKPGGALIFDVSTPYKLREVLGNNTRTYVDDESAYIWHNRFHARNKTLSMALTIFVKGAKGVYERVEEAQVQRAYDKDELKEALKSTGFEKIRILGGMRLTSAREKDERWHIIAQKPLKGLRKQCKETHVN